VTSAVRAEPDVALTGASLCHGERPDKGDVSSIEIRGQTFDKRGGIFVSKIVDNQYGRS
jgi:hypothetical protein